MDRRGGLLSVIPGFIPVTFTLDAVAADNPTRDRDGPYSRDSVTVRHCAALRAGWGRQLCLMFHPAEEPLRLGNPPSPLFVHTQILSVPAQGVWVLFY